MGKWEVDIEFNGKSAGIELTLEALIDGWMFKYISEKHMKMQ
jgi:hypothetical protein